MTSLKEIMTSLPLFQNNLTLRTPEIVNFAENIKAAIMLIKTTLRDSKKVKKNAKFSKMQFLSVFTEIIKIDNS